MDERPRESVATMTEKHLGELHLYKELMTPEERTGRYYLLRLSGATRPQAIRWRDWSPPHFEMALAALNQTKI